MFELLSSTSCSWVDSLFPAEEVPYIAAEPVDGFSYEVVLSRLHASIWAVLLQEVRLLEAQRCNGMLIDGAASFASQYRLANHSLTLQESQQLLEEGLSARNHVLRHDVFVRLEVEVCHRPTCLQQHEAVVQIVECRINVSPQFFLSADVVVDELQLRQEGVLSIKRDLLFQRASLRLQRLQSVTVLFGNWVEEPFSASKEAEWEVLWLYFTTASTAEDVHSGKINTTHCIICTCTCRCWVLSWQYNFTPSTFQDHIMIWCTYTYMYSLYGYLKNSNKLIKDS